MLKRLEMCYFLSEKPAVCTTLNGGRGTVLRDVKCPKNYCPRLWLFVSLGPEYFFELIYLPANGNYSYKLSDILHEIIRIKIELSKSRKIV